MVRRLQGNGVRRLKTLHSKPNRTQSNENLLRQSLPRGQGRAQRGPAMGNVKSARRLSSLFFWVDGLSLILKRFLSGA